MCEAYAIWVNNLKITLRVKPQCEFLVPPTLPFKGKTAL